MTNTETKLLEGIRSMINDMTKNNQDFRNSIVEQISAIDKKVQSKHLPVTLEQDILSTAVSSVQAAIKEALTKYDSPLIKLVKTVVEEHNTELKTLISDSFKEVIRKEDFKQSIVQAFSHKVARTIISNNDGLFDKVANDLKQDAVFKSRMAIAVSDVVNECLINKNA